MGVKVPNYRLKNDVTVSWGSDKKLLTGTWVKPIDKYYLPQHIKDTTDYEWMNHETHIYCYTSMGFIIVRREDITEG